MVTTTGSRSIGMDFLEGLRELTSGEIGRKATLAVATGILVASAIPTRAQQPTPFPIGKYLPFVPNGQNITLRMLIEQVTGKPVPTVFAERIFKPLGLTCTSWPTSAKMPVPYAHGFTVQTLDNKRADAIHRDPSWAFTAAS